MIKFITDYFKKEQKKNKEYKTLLKIRKKATGYERLTKYHKVELLKYAMGDDRKTILLDIIDTLEDHEKRINTLRSLDIFRNVK